ncbi:predicted protein [Thalassiosira pseudonana CCMP1335]|uniref:Potassium channel domain-containing protein n=1 Tax=Thalassiosira pseudonana TaxID=35128 RepID=B5YLX1_THAPS|nr:predicted protein [Thalassiosira pseudonana CCMP1335]ACI64151.1 predicted protein [Thalassiosira pseudonana CCMP1335]
MSRVVLILLDGRQTLIVIRYHYFGQFRVSRGFNDKVCPIANEMVLHLVREISIGYGNIVPVTRSEYYFANLLMLMSGIFWAFVIGNLVKVVSHVNRVKEQYKIRMAEANDMLSEFSRDIPDSDKDNFSVGDPEAKDEEEERIHVGGDISIIETTLARITEVSEASANEKVSRDCSVSIIGVLVTRSPIQPCNEVYIHGVCKGRNLSKASNLWTWIDDHEEGSLHGITARKWMD